MQGVAGEDKIQLSKEESQQVKLRSRKLLLSLIYPVRGRLLLSLLIVILSQALRVAGPALIALSIDWALPAALKSETTPLFLVVGGYLFAAAATASLISFHQRAVGYRRQRDDCWNFVHVVYRNRAGLS
jgi:ATP-binding cassette subfamily B protein